MGLINLKTNLKGYGFINSPELYIAKGSVDLKFGSDEPGNGNSKQPFIQTRIPATDEPLQTSFSNAGSLLGGIGAGAAIGAIGGSILGGTGTGAAVGAAVGLGIAIAGQNATGTNIKVPSAGTGGTDFLLRGGTLLPGIIANDEERLAKFFKSTDGVLFTVKQNLLSRIAVRTQASTGLLNDGVYTPVSTLLEAAGNPFGLHVNKQGLNPFGDTFYAKTISNEINDTLHDGLTKNRLYGLYATKVGQFDNPLIPFYVKNNIAEDPYGLIAYQGGPGSFLGIGKTIINYATDNAGAPLSIVGVSTDSTLNYGQLNNISDKTHDQNSSYKGTQVVDFRKKLKQDLNTTIFSKSPEYSGPDAKNIELRVNLGDPGNPSGKNLTSYVTGNYGGAASIDSFDKINASILYQSYGPQNTNNDLNPDSAVNNDLVKFRIGVIDNDTPSKKTYIHFRAFLDTISDSYSADWQATKYIGRGENFYTYNGFERKVSLSWTVAAQSKKELIPMYKKLNYLASLCAPDYSNFGYMRGNIVTLTVGGYFYEQPGIITSLSYEMNDESDSWEIGIDDKGKSDPSVKELPHIIRVRGFNFIPIHDFVPRKQQNTFGNDNYVNTYGSERYIALAAGTSRGDNNYDYIENIESISPRPVTLI